MLIDAIKLRRRLEKELIRIRSLPIQRGQAAAYEAGMAEGLEMALELLSELEPRAPLILDGAPDVPSHA
jgi:hypothetical protein